MPNTVALMMLAIWPVVTVILARKLSIQRLLIWSVLCAYLVLPPLPAAIDLPLLSPFNKETLPNISLLCVLLYLTSGRLQLLPRTLLGKILVFAFVLSPIATTLTNTDPLVFQRSTVRELRLIDAVSLSINQFLTIISYLLARQYLANREGLREILVALMVGGLAYSLPMLIEIGVGPVLNLNIYGFMQHSLEQMMRQGGFRPLVFLSHGIWVAFFIMLAFSSAVTLWRNHRAESDVNSYASPKWLKNGKLLFWAAGYLGAVLFLSKTLAPLIYASVFVGIFFIAKNRFQTTLAFFLALAVLIYPIFKALDLTPADQIIEQVSKFSEERAASLQFRIENENILLERAQEKPVFGWGSWGRNQVHDPSSGEILSVSDGRWIITLGTFGWVGFIAEIGLLMLPLWLLFQGMAMRSNEPLFPGLGALALLLAINIADLIPNATLTPLTWLLAGALLGFGERLVSVRNDVSEGFSAQSGKRRKTII